MESFTRRSFLLSSVVIMAAVVGGDCKSRQPDAGALAVGEWVRLSNGAMFGYQIAYYVPSGKIHFVKFTKQDRESILITEGGENGFSLVASPRYGMGDLYETIVKYRDPYAIMADDHFKRSFKAQIDAVQTYVGDSDPKETRIALEANLKRLTEVAKGWSDKHPTLVQQRTGLSLVPR